MSKRLDKIVAEQNAAAAEAAWADNSTHVSAATPGLLKRLFGGQNDRQAKAGRTKPLIYTRPRRRWLRPKGDG